MELLEKLAACIPTTAMSSPLQLANFAFGGSYDDAALAYYGIQRSENEMNVGSDANTITVVPECPKSRNWSSVVPFIASFERLSDLAMLGAECFVSWTGDTAHTSRMDVPDMFACIASCFCSG